MGAVGNWHGRLTGKPLLATTEMSIFLISLLFFSQVFASPRPPRPEELDPNDDAEVFGGPVRTNTDYDSDFLPGGFGGFRPRVRVFVLPLAGSEDTESVFPGQRPQSFGNVFNILRSILGNRPSLVPSSEDDTAVTESKRPCLLCSFFKDSFDDVQDHINTVKDRENEIDFDPNEDGLDINNSTHTRKVLEDGSVVHINKTVIADTDEDGNSFYFHRAVFHNIGNSEVSEENDANETEETTDEVSDLSNEKEEPEDDPETGIDEGLLA